MNHAHHILLIEDDPGIAQSLKNGLSREGYKISWEAEGAPGVAFARDGGPHLIILDVRLPDGSGYDFCREIRQLGLRQPIIMLTVQNTETDKVIGLEMGADDFVTKPFSLRELLSRIRAQLRRAYGELSITESDTLYVNDLVIDRLRGTILRGNAQLNLSPTEQRLLIYLAQHPNQVLSRSQILDAVWGYARSTETDQIVTVNVRRLREKIEHDPGDPRLIRTVPGQGYKLVT